MNIISVCEYNKEIPSEYLVGVMILRDANTHDKNEFSLWVRLVSVLHD